VRGTGTDRRGYLPAGSPVKLVNPGGSSRVGGPSRSTNAIVGALRTPEALERFDRSDFLKLGVTLVSTGAWLGGCGDAADDDSGPGNAGSAGDSAGSGTGGAAAGGSASGSGGGTSECSADATFTHTSSVAHDHLPLTTPITALLLNSRTEIAYALPNENGHIHTLTLTSTDLAGLRAGMTISKTTSEDMGHVHGYDIRCVP
jgi:hypothetical protein